MASEEGQIPKVKIKFMTSELDGLDVKRVRIIKETVRELSFFWIDKIQNLHTKSFNS